MMFRYKRPLDDYVLIVPIVVTRLGAIIMPGHKPTEDSRIYARVTMVGPGRWENGQRVPMQVEVGDLVVLGPNMGGGGYKFLGEEKFIRESAIAFVIEEDAESVVHHDGRLCGESSGKVSEFLSDVDCQQCLDLGTNRAISVASS